MKQKPTTPAGDRLEKLLAGTPIVPSADFSRRVYEACADAAIDAELAKMPIVPAADFTERVLAEIRKKPANTLAFPQRFFRMRKIFRLAVAGIAATIAVGIVFLAPRRVSLNEQVAKAVNADPELAALASAEEEFSFGELIAVSQLLTTLNANSDQTSDFFAYYEN